MRIKKIKTDAKDINKIIHCADIHIRNWKRHKEYKSIFKKLDLDLAQLADERTIITVGGDIAHAKTDMSPELIDIMSLFFRTLTKHAPTIVIAGNHDANLNNANRLDAITPVVDLLKDPNLFYLKDTGLYRLDKLVFSVFSVFDSPDKYIKASEIPDKYTKIAMYHGTVGNSITDTGMHLTSGLDISAFEGYDYGLLGDIHKRQFLRSDLNVFFPGSLIQQNFGESYDNHGYAVLNLETKENFFVDIPNDYGYCTIKIEDGKLPPKEELDSLNLTQSTSLRVKTTKTSPSQLKKALSHLRSEYRVKPTIVQNIDKVGGFRAAGSIGEYACVDAWNVEYQNTLIKQQLEGLGKSEEEINSIIDINRKLHKALPTKDHVRNVVWNPKWFKFSNMFSYGEDNVFNFENKQGVYGLFAPNHRGKSALLDAMCFCLFDESFRASKADEILNINKNSFSCEFAFELDGVEYHIRRTSSTNKYGPQKGKQRVDVDFWYLKKDGSSVSLNGEQRRDTNKIIQSYIGTFNDFVLTSLSLQNSNTNFVDKKQSERKDMLANFLDLDVFDHLYELASNEIKASNVLLKEYEKQDFQTRLGDEERIHKTLLEKYENTTKTAKLFESELKTKKSSVSAIREQIIDVGHEDTSIDALIAEEKATLDKIKQNDAELVRLDKVIQDGEKELKRCVGLLSNLNESEIKQKASQMETSKKNLQNVNHKLEKIEISVKHNLTKLDHLAKHEYDPNCKYCVNNDFVKDAKNTQKSLEEQKIEVNRLIKERETLTTILQDSDAIKKTADEFEDLTTKVKKYQREIDFARSQKDYTLELATNSKDKLTTLTKRKENYYNNEKAIEANKRLREEIDNINKEIEKLEEEYKHLLDKKQDEYAKIQVADNTIKELEGRIQHMQSLSDDVEGYNTYLSIISRNGIPYNLISKALPHLQEYINSILTTVGSFTLELETDGKNVNVLIDYDGRKWPLELASGMEKFLAALAIRVALIKISNLPRPNFIAIDEGLGVLDANNLNSMHMFFSSLKDYFDFTLIISHIDVVRDMVDKVIDIDRKENFSYINN